MTREQAIEQLEARVRGLAGFSHVHVEWASGGRVHNWRNYILAETKVLWASLGNEARLCIAVAAEIRADAENWD